MVITCMHAEGQSVLHVFCQTFTFSCLRIRLYGKVATVHDLLARRARS